MCPRTSLPGVSRESPVPQVQGGIRSHPSNMPDHLLNLCESSLHVEESVSRPRPPSPLLPTAWSQAGTHQTTRNARIHFSSVQSLSHVRLFVTP